MPTDPPSNSALRAHFLRSTAALRLTTDILLAPGLISACNHSSVLSTIVLYVSALLIYLFSTQTYSHVLVGMSFYPIHVGNSGRHTCTLI